MALFRLFLKFDLRSVGLTQLCELCSLCCGSAMPEQARSLRSPYAEVELGFSCCTKRYEKGSHTGAFFIPSAGVEPTTRCLEGNCSIQLSYDGVVLIKVAQI